MVWPTLNRSHFSGNSTFWVNKDKRYWTCNTELVGTNHPSPTRLRHCKILHDSPAPQYTQHSHSSLHYLMRYSVTVVYPGFQSAGGTISFPSHLSSFFPLPFPINPARESWETGSAVSSHSRSMLHHKTSERIFRVKITHPATTKFLRHLIIHAALAGVFVFRRYIASH